MIRQGGGSRSLGRHLTLSPTRTQLLCLLGVAGGLLAYVWQHIEGIRLGYRVERLRVEVARLRNTVVHQRARLSSLTALERVDAFAKETLGLRVPRPDEVTSLPLDAPGTEPGPSGPRLPDRLRRWPP